MKLKSLGFYPAFAAALRVYFFILGFGSYPSRVNIHITSNVVNLILGPVPIQISSTFSACAVRVSNHLNFEITNHNFETIVKYQSKEGYKIQLISILTTFQLDCMPLRMMFSSNILMHTKLLTCTINISSLRARNKLPRCSQDLMISIEIGMSLLDYI